MAIQLHPDARERVSIVLATDPVISDVNDPETLAAYSSSGDESGLTVPADASRVEIVPLTASVRAKIYNILATVGDTEDDRLDAIARLQVLTVEHGLRAISDLPDVKPVIVAGTERYPREYIDRLAGESVWDIAQHITRISEIPESGKERSSAQSGSATDAARATPEPGTASSAGQSQHGSGSEATAEAPSSPGSAEGASETG